MEALVIVGGGVAGLSCLNALLDRDLSPLLLDASTIGSPKMCGEFLAPSAIVPLNKWGIGPLQLIKKARFLCNDRTFKMTFPREAGAFSRHAAESALAHRAREKGGQIREGASIQTITPASQNKPFLLQLTSGETIEAKDVIFATGKWSRAKPPVDAATYIGFKTHVPLVMEPQTLVMHSLKGGYLGMVPVSADVSNITCLVKREVIEKAGSCRDFLTGFMQHDGLETLDWLEGDAPAFGVKMIPNWPHAYWIGDALLSVHPAIGYGFAHAVSSACMAADYYLKRDAVGYHQSIRRLVRSKRILGASMHYLLQRPHLCRAVSPIVGKNPGIAHQLLTFCDY